MDDPYNQNYILIDRLFDHSPQKVILSGSNLNIPEIIAVARKNPIVEFTKDKKILNRIRECYLNMIKDIKKGVPIYGCNTGFGARASHIVNTGSPTRRLALAKRISEGITHIDVSVGPHFESEVVRAAILIRINMLMKGVSAVKLRDLEIYRQMLNKQLTPCVNQYGGIGASGDLAHNCRILNAARQMDNVYIKDQNGQISSAKDAFGKAGIRKLKLDPKAGLGLVNGDNFSTALASILAIDTLQVLVLATAIGAMTIEVLRGSNRTFHPLLSQVRPHQGQKEVAYVYRYLLSGSKLIFNEMREHKKRKAGIKIQDGYSLRGIAQYHGVNIEKVKAYLKTITINANSVSDNPLWVSPEYAIKGERPWHWVSGGNFLAMHMVEVIDGLRKIMTQIVKLNDRHLSRLVNPDESNGLAANLSDKHAVTQCAFKGVQIQSGMFDVYSSLLSIPVSTFFGVHEENNQDITSHSLTSGILALENLRLVRYSIAQNMIALCQAVDLRGGSKRLSPKTRTLYHFIRERVHFVKKERSLNNDIEIIYQEIVGGKLIKLARESIFNDYNG